MITENGYSKDPSIIPEGIAITFGKEQLEKIGIKETLRQFNSWLGNMDNQWWHSTSKKPVQEFDHVYIIVLNRLYCRCYYGGYERGAIILAGPIERPPFKRKLPGFRGFRYTTKLW